MEGLNNAMTTHYFDETDLDICTRNFEEALFIEKVRASPEKTSLYYSLAITCRANMHYTGSLRPISKTHYEPPNGYFNVFVEDILLLTGLSRRMLVKARCRLKREGFIDWLPVNKDRFFCKLVQSNADALQFDNHKE